eukprot:TRINITY_DN880_c3_g1_i1.p1 TRINITY_DN880_c3_g1~~TRINITY_DN880_c3_g1_i1.p1  ORF type:complete len:2042 (+),score=488.60 TRINITY_DN880_c3_g1_i1:217-6342(+)
MSGVTLESVNPAACTDMEWQNFKEAALKNARDQSGYLKALANALEMRFSGGENSRITGLLQSLLADDKLVKATTLVSVAGRVPDPKKELPSDCLQQITEECSLSDRAQVCLSVLCAFISHPTLQSIGIAFGKAILAGSTTEPFISSLPADVKYCILRHSAAFGLSTAAQQALRAERHEFVPLFELVGPAAGSNDAFICEELFMRAAPTAADIAECISIIHTRRWEHRAFCNQLKSVVNEGFTWIDILRAYSSLSHVAQDAKVFLAVFQETMDRKMNISIACETSGIKLSLLLKFSAESMECDFNTYRVQDSAGLHGNEPWKSIDYVEALITTVSTSTDAHHLKEALAKGPIAHCPGVLLVSLCEVENRPRHFQDILSSTLYAVLKACDPQIIQAINLSPDTILQGLEELRSKEAGYISLLAPAVPVIVLHKLLEACRAPTIFIELLAGSFEKDFGGTWEWTRGVLNNMIPIRLEQPLMDVLAQLPQHIIAKFPEGVGAPQAPPTPPPLPVQPAPLALPTEEWPQNIEEEIQDFMTKLFKEGADVNQLVSVIKGWKVNGQNEYHCLVYSLLRELAYIKDFPTRELRLMASLFGKLVKGDLLLNDKLLHALQYVLHVLKYSTNENEREFCFIAMNIYRPKLSSWPNYCEKLKEVPHLEQLMPGITLDMSPETANPSAIHQLDISTLTNKMDEEINIITPPAHIIEKTGFIVNNLDLAKMEQSIDDLKELITPEYYPYFSNYLVKKRISLEPNFHKLYQTMLDTIKSKELDNYVLQASYMAVRTLLSSQKITTNSSERSLLKNLGGWIGLQTLARNKSLLARELNLRDLLMSAMEQGKLIAVAPFVSKILEHAASSKVFRPPNPWLMGILEVMVDIHQLPDIKLTLKFEVEVLCKSLDLKINDLIDTTTTGRRQQQRTKLEEMWSKLSHNNNSDFHMQTQRVPTPPQQEWGQQQEPQQPPPPQQQQQQQQQPPQQQLQQPQSPSHQMKPQAQEWYPRAMQQAQATQPYQSNQATWDSQHRELLPKPKPTGLSIVIPQEFLMSPHAEIMKEAVMIGLQESIKNLQETQSLPQRASTVAIKATAELVFKDFIVESDDMLVCEAAEGVVTVLANQLAMVQAKGGLTGTMTPKIIECLKNGMPPYIPQEQFTDIANKLTTENLHLGVTVICNSAKALALDGMKLEIEKHLRDRNNFRSHGGWSEGMKAVDIFRRLMPNPTQTQVDIVSKLKDPLFPFPMLHMHRELYKSFRNFEDSCLAELEAVFLDIEQNLDLHFKESREPLSLTQLEFGQQNYTAHHVRVRDLVKSIPVVLKKLSLDDILRIVAWSCKKMFKYALESPHQEIVVFLTEVCLFVLQDVVKSHPEEVKAEATTQFLNCEKRWSLKDTARNFIGLKLIDMTRLDECLSRELRSAKNNVMASTVDFVRTLVQKCVIDEKLVPQSDFNLSLNFLQEAVKKQRERLVVRVPSLIAYQPDGKPWRDKVLSLFNQQLVLYVKKCQGGDKPQEETQILTKLQTAGLLHESNLDKFLSLLVETSVEHFSTLVYKAGPVKYEKQVGGKLKTGGRPAATPPKPPIMLADQPDLFRGVDASCELIFRLIKGCSWKTLSEDGTAGLHLVKKVLSVVTAVLVNNHEFHASRGSAAWINTIDKEEHAQQQFMQQPYFRLFSNLLGNLSYIIPKGPNEPELLKAFLNHICEMLKMLIPSKVPGFAFAWLDVIAHRVLLPKLIQYNSDAYLRLLSAAIVYLSPALKTAEFTEPQRLFYKGLLKVFMVINHDFPTFLYKYFVPLCTVIPRNCFQLRNVVLSAKPKGVRLPEYCLMYTKDAKDINGLPSPKLASEYVEALMTEGVLEVETFDGILHGGVTGNVCAKVVAQIMKESSDGVEPGPVYDLKLINALVARTATVCTDSSMSAEERQTCTRNTLLLVRGMLELLPVEGKYNVVSSMCNHLRDVNTHTYHFGNLLLALFEDQQDELLVQELIASVLVERTLEHTTLFLWGVLGTLSELLRNEKYNFWEKPFSNATPQINQFFNALQKAFKKQPGQKTDAQPN